MYNEIKLWQLKRERQAIKENRDTWVKLNRDCILDESLARTFKAYELAINRKSIAIRILKGQA